MKLLSPTRLGSIDVKNRIAMAPMTRSRAGAERIPNALMAEHYRQRASAGLLITEATVVSPQGIGYNNTPGIYNDEMAAGWKQVVDSVHAAGGKIALQLWHCGRASHSDFHQGALPVSASALRLNGDHVYTPLGKKPYETPRALNLSEIPGIVDDYRRATVLAKSAGFDAVEIHSANGYLLDQFLQSKTNQRIDAYGGSIENRFRFLREVTEAVCGVIGADRVGVRLSPNGVFNDMGSPDFREQFLYAASELDGYDLAYLHVMDGLAFGFHKLGDPLTLPEFRSVFSAPLIGNCGYDRDAVEAALVSGAADMIAIGRPYISNPDLVERYAHNWPLAPCTDMSKWYTPGAAGYTDYPVYNPPS
jgi:N-ethylmaleimide reductase